MARRLCHDLKQAGITPWLDKEKLLPGQRWKVAITQAMKESAYIVALLSSHSVSKRGFVQRELKKALDLLDELPPSEIFIIPARLDDCEPVDERLQDLHWVDLFESYEEGFTSILQVLRSGHEEIPREIPSPSTGTWAPDISRRRQELEAEYELLSEKIHRLRMARAIETDAADTFKLDKQIEDAEVRQKQIAEDLKASESSQEPKEPATTAPHQEPRRRQEERRQKEKPPRKAGKPQEVAKPQEVKKAQETRRAPKFSLRSEPLTVSEKEFTKVFGLDEDLRPLEYIQNDYEAQGEVVVDHATGLVWQKSGSKDSLTYEKALEYVQKLNQEKFAGYNDWRLPTIPELMSLLEPEKQSNDLYINPMFDAEQWWCWSADRLPEGEGGSSGAAWRANFYLGHVYWLLVKNFHYVRCVRSRRT